MDIYIFMEIIIYISLNIQISSNFNESRLTSSRNTIDDGTQ